MRRAAWSRPAIRGASLRRAIAVALAALMIGAFFSAPTASAQTNVIQVTFDTPPYTYPASYSFRDFSVHQTNTYSAGYVGQAITSSGDRHTYGGRDSGLAAAFTMRFWSPVPVHTISAWVYLDPSSSANGCLRWGNLQLVCVSPSPNWQYVQATYPANVTAIQLSFGVYSMTTTTVGLDQVTIWPTAPSTPTPTPTPSPTPIGGQPPLGVPCRLLGADANFTGFPGRWQIVQGDPIKTWQGLLLTADSQIRLRLPLAESRRYRITGVYTVGFRELLTGGEKFYVGLGGVTMEFPLENVTTPQIISVPPVQYPPTDDGYYLTLTAPEGTEFGLVIRDICVSEVPSEDQPVTSGSAETCSACDPPQSLFDIFGIIGWLLCGIRNFFECLFIPFLRGLLQGLLNLVPTALSFIQWIVETAFNGVLWIVQILVAPFIWIIAHIRNFFTNVANDLQVGTLASLGNIGVSYARDLPTMLGNGLASLGNELSNILQNARSVFDLIGGLFNLFVRGLAYLITLTPLIIETLISGFNASATAISGSPICTNSSDFLYAVCLGFYVIDNTILSGPAFYLIPLVIGLLVFDTFVWAFQAIRKAFS
jgi:hypothetical protein